MFDLENDFKLLKYDVLGKSSLINLPQLRRYYVLLSTHPNADLYRSDMDKLITYIMVLYDKRSPLVKQITNISLRKSEAAKIAGYDELKDEIKPLFEFTDRELQILVIEFLKDQNDMFWSMIVSNEQTFWEYQNALMQKIISFKDDKQRMDALNVKSKLMDECDVITERVEAYRTKVFGTGEEQSKAKEHTFSPEGIALRDHNV